MIETLIILQALTLSILIWSELNFKKKINKLRKQINKY